MKILLAIDDSPCSRAAVEEVLRDAWPAGTEIRVVSVVEYPRITESELWVLPTEYIARMENAAQDRLQALITRNVNRLRAGLGPQFNISGHVLKYGDPKAVLLEEADNWKADLIIVGSHGYHGFKRLWLGSVSHAVLANAGCSVRIVRCPAAETMHPAPAVLSPAEA